eukprot:scaffold13.g419.t1
MAGALGEEELLSNWQQQVDEVAALASIYAEDFRLRGAEGVAGLGHEQDGVGEGCGGQHAEAAAESPTGGGPRGQQQELTAEALADAPPPAGAAWALDCSLLVRVELPAGQLSLLLKDQKQARQQDGSNAGSSTACEREQQQQQQGQGGREEQRQQQQPRGQGAERTHSREAAAAAAQPPAAAEEAEEQGAGESAGARYVVRHLPPLSLQLRLGPAYPSAAPPGVSLSGAWLSAGAAAALEVQLRRLWEEQGPGAPVCHTLADWLQSGALAHLGATEMLVLGSGTGGSGGEQGQELPAAAAGEPGDGDSLGQDAGQAAEQALVDLLRYDAGQELKLFREQMHTCSICFEEQVGRAFVRLDCRHAFCSACLAEQARVHVAEGSLEGLRCPEPGCGEALGPAVLRKLLGAEAFERWEQLTLQRTLDTMSDAAYCPRCSTVALEDSDSCAQCPRCFFVFCSLCSEGWHPGSQCVSAETKLAMLRHKMRGGSKAVIADLRRREQELASLAQIEKTSKRCPACGTAVQKAEGCNKMTCGGCGAFFCYNGECVLFDEEEVLRWEAQNDAVAEADAARRGGRARGCPCPQCGQRNFKIGNNNHLCCWACTSHFCYRCRQALRGRGGTHFGPGKCRQHSDD